MAQSASEQLLQIRICCTYKKQIQRHRRSTVEVFERMEKKIEVIKNSIDEIKQPRGKKDNPARYCKDMYICNAGKKDGEIKFTVKLTQLSIDCSGAIPSHSKINFRR